LLVTVHNFQHFHKYTTKGMLGEASWTSKGHSRLPVGLGSLHPWI
jgi:hypothetical protein